MTWDATSKNGIQDVLILIRKIFCHSLLCDLNLFHKLMPGGCQCGFHELPLEIFSNCQKCRLTRPHGNEQIIVIGKAYKGLTTTIDLFFHCLFSLPFLLTFSLGGIWLEGKYVNHSLTQQTSFVPWLSDTDLSIWHIFIDKAYKKKKKIKKHEDHYIAIRMAKISNSNSTKASKDVEWQKLSCVAGENAKWHSHVGRELKVS